VPTLFQNLRGSFESRNAHRDNRHPKKEVKDHSPDPEQTPVEAKPTKVMEEKKESMVTKVEQENKQQDIHKQHLIQTLQSLQYMKHVAQPSEDMIKARSVKLPFTKHKKTLIFDLDETLVHCIDDIDNTPYDHPISVTFPSGETIKAGINVRPFAYECLKKASEHY